MTKSVPFIQSFNGRNDTAGWVTGLKLLRSFILWRRSPQNHQTSGSVHILDWSDWIWHTSVVIVDVYHHLLWTHATVIRVLYLTPLMLQPSAFGLRLQRKALYVVFFSLVSEPDAQLLFTPGRLNPGGWATFQHMKHALHCLLCTVWD